MTETFKTLAHIVSHRQRERDLARVRAAVREERAHIPFHVKAMDAITVIAIDFDGDRHTVAFVVNETGARYVAALDDGPDGSPWYHYYRDHVADDTCINAPEAVDLLSGIEDGKYARRIHDLLMKDRWEQFRDHDPTLRDLDYFLGAIHGAWGW